MNIITIREKDDPTGVMRKNAIKYWCNSLGELHHYGKHNIKEDQLPEPLRKLYNEVWCQGYGFPCYLAEVDGKYGIAFGVYYDTAIAAEHHMDPSMLFDVAREDVDVLLGKEEFNTATVLVLENVEDEETEMMVFFPVTESGDVPELNFCYIAKILSDVIWPKIQVDEEPKEAAIKVEADPGTLLKQYLLQEAKFRAIDVFGLNNHDISQKLVEKCAEALLNRSEEIFDFEAIDHIMRSVILLEGIDLS